MTPEERREAYIEEIAEQRSDQVDAHQDGSAPPYSSESAVDALLAYFDNHEDPNERALGQALRYGLTPLMDDNYNITFRINTPEGVEKASTQYNPDPIINAEVAADALEAERFDLSVGYAPRRWTCECGASHDRGHFQTIGVHRCLVCGYVGPDGVMSEGAEK